MLIFSLALGVFHVLFGLAIALFEALRRRKHRKAAGHLVTISLIICLTALLVSLIIPSPWLLSRPILVVAGILIPLLFLSGGLLAPLEFIKQIGNIISYSRIMAIGLSSVLLANAANHLAGLPGDLILGMLAAIALHAVALVLGTFAPTIHALRLHYVEFLSKFIEHGGKKFEPLQK
jgi:V/A-type H+-transporting ATPase subunit I